MTEKARLSPSHPLVSEIVQMQEQYLFEVSRRKAPWPESIKRRIMELWGQGFSSQEIAKLIKISPQTLYNWKSVIKQKEAQFVSVPVVVSKEDKASLGKRAIKSPSVVKTSTVSKSSTVDDHKNSTVTVVLPSGVRIEGLESAVILKLIAGARV